MAIGNKEQVMLGAGEWFVKPYEGGKVKCKEVCVEENYMGHTQGGAQITYTMTPYVIEDDNGKVKRAFMTVASATMKTGLLTFDTNSLGSLMSVGELTKSEDGERTVLNLSGGHAELKRFAVVFRYCKDKEADKYLYVGMVATNTASMTLAFTKDKETVPEIEFTADDNGEDDTILVIEEDDDTEAQASTASEDGSAPEQTN